MVVNAEIVDMTEQHEGGTHARETLKNKLIEHRQYIRVHGDDLPEIRDWQWTPAPGPEVRAGNEAVEEPV